MKCPKCDYVSFDYNLECPNCSRPLKDQRDKLGISELKPIESFDGYFDGTVGSISSIVSKVDQDEIEFDLEDEEETEDDPLKSFVLD